MGRYHFIAIGGIGMSGLAKYLLEDGHTVSGSDIAESKYIDKLRELGATVFIGHSAENVPADAVIVKSSAIKDNNPELIRAKELGLKILHRSDLLEEIAKSAQEAGKCFIGFSGTHGKTTTSGMASYVLAKAGLEPSFVDGGIIPEYNTNAQHRNGKYFIAELDESDGTIVKYNPDILVINNLEEDHLDFYKNGMSDLIETFNKVILQSKKVLINNDNNGTRLLSGKFITYGLNDADYTAKNICYAQDGTSFEIYHNGTLLLKLKIQLSGVHNVYNTLAVVAALNEGAGVGVNEGVNVGVNEGVNPVDEITESSLKEFAKYFEQFSGMGRRFQKVAEFGGIKVYDDYAHHPTEIRATLEAAALKFGKENVVAVFQPHRYTRLKALWKEFAQAFDAAGRIIVTDVYAASEEPIEGVSGEAFAKSLDGAEYIKGSMADVAKTLLPTLKSGDAVIGLGAGSITSLGKNLEAVRLLNVKTVNV